MKKGSYFMPLLMAIVLIILLWTFIVMVSKHNGFQMDIGSGQGAILAAESRAEKALFYIDRSARYSAETAAYSLAEQGGFYDQPECGRYLGVAIWNANGRECWPEKPDEEFGKYFSDEIRERLAIYPDIPLAGVKYATVADGRTLYAFAEEPLVFDILLHEPTILPEDIALYKKTIAKKVSETYKAPPAVSVDAQYSWPGQSNVVTSCYGWRDIDYGSTEHRGIDIRASVGDPVYAIADGKAKVLNDAYNSVIIEHSGLVSMYLHNSEVLILDKDEVKKGQLIALAGKAGAQFPHIHLTIKRGSEYIDPLDPKNRLFDINKLAYKTSANCIYACNQYGYCQTMMERKA
jgi:murein DD-endopeptidase MepM/ murein hydrolase activator NlpD